MQDLLQQATQLKQAQVDQERPVWNGWPCYLQNTLFHAERDAARTADRFAVALPSAFGGSAEEGDDDDDSPDVARRRAIERVRVATTACQALKQAGNELFQQGQFTDAGFRYEEAAGIFDYCVGDSAQWKKDGIKDAHLTARFFAKEWRLWAAACDSASDAAAFEDAAALLATVYCNIAVCAARQQRWDVSLQASRHVLQHLDAGSVKAAHRAAVALTTPASATARDTGAAVDILRAAIAEHQRVHGGGSGGAKASQRAEAEALLASLEAERRSTAAKGRKMFAGVFEREEWRAAAEEEEAAAADNNPGAMTTTARRQDSGDLPDNSEAHDAPRFPAAHAKAPIFRDTAQAWAVVDRMRQEAMELAGRGGPDGTARAEELQAKAASMQRDLVGVCAEKLWKEALAPAMATSPALLTLHVPPGDPMHLLDNTQLGYGRSVVRLLGFDAARWNAQCAGREEPTVDAKERQLFDALAAKCRQDFAVDRVARMRPEDAVVCLAAQGLAKPGPCWLPGDKADAGGLRAKLTAYRQRLWDATALRSWRAAFSTAPAE